ADLLTSYFSCFCFFFRVPAPTYIYTLSLHDALPIWRRVVALPHAAAGRDAVAAQRRRRRRGRGRHGPRRVAGPGDPGRRRARPLDRKSTRLNSSHVKISYAVFCLKKKKKKTSEDETN